MLKGATLEYLQYDTVALIALMLLGHDDRRDALPPHARLRQNAERHSGARRRREPGIPTLTCVL
jgi:hypothetical protein